MSEQLRIEPNPPKCETKDLQPWGFFGRHLRHIIPDGVEWNAPLAAGYWRGQVAKLAPGDRVDVSTHDYEIQYELSIIRVSDDPDDLKMFTRCFIRLGWSYRRLLRVGRSRGLCFSAPVSIFIRLLILRPGAR